MARILHKNPGNRLLKTYDRHGKVRGEFGKYSRFPLKKTNRLLILIFMLVLFITILLTSIPLQALACWI